MQNTKKVVQIFSHTHLATFEKSLMSMQQMTIIFRKKHTRYELSFYLLFVKAIKMEIWLTKKQTNQYHVPDNFFTPNIKSYVYNFKILNQLWGIVQIECLSATQKQTAYMCLSHLFSR